MSTSRPHPTWASTGFSFDELTAVLDVSVDPDELKADLASLPTEHGGVLGAQLLGQMVSACEGAMPGKVVSTMRMHFLRPSDSTRPAQLRLRRLADGRRFGTLEVDIRQCDRLVARGEALMGLAMVNAPDNPIPDSFDDLPADTAPDARALWPWEVRTGLHGHGPVPGSAGMELWAQVPGVAAGSTFGRALLAYATESLIIPLAIDLDNNRGAGGRLPQAVLGHSVTFIAPVDLGRWHRLGEEVVSHVGENLVGRGMVWDETGSCVALTETRAIVARSVTG